MLGEGNSIFCRLQPLKQVCSHHHHSRGGRGGGVHVGTIGGFSEVLSSSLPPSLVSFRGVAPRSSLFFDNGREA